MGNTKIDPVTLSTVWHTFQRVCHEMRDVLERTAVSYLIGQLHDNSVGIWDARGRTVAIPVGLTSQFVGSKFPVQFILERFKGNIHSGDVFLTNDPYNGGFNNHLPDWGFFRPIFFEGELLFFTLCRAHQMDTGGSFPGGYFANGFDIHAEGLCIPPIKVVEQGRERTDVMELIWNNVRFRESVRVDNASMIATTKVCENRLQEMLRHYGRDVVMACVDEMMDRTERAVREEIRKIPDGTYYGEGATDDDGTELDVPVWVRVEVTVAGDEISIDFSKSDAQRKGFINQVYAATYSASIGAMILFFDTGLVDYHNEGTMRPVKVVAPDGLVVSGTYPATVGGGPANITERTLDAMYMAMSKALPHRAIAGWARHRGDYVFGIDPRTSQQYVRTTFDYDGGAGAVAGYDGYVGAVIMGAVHRGNVEEEEVRFPWRMLKYEIAPDLEGAGKWRGAPGTIWESANEGAEVGMATGSSDGELTTGAGVLGGQPTPLSEAHIRRGSELILARGHRMHRVRQGDSVLKVSGGGAGVAPPGERDPEKVSEDVANGIVSIGRAREVYKVALDPDTFAVDREQTEALRRAGP
ncbi:MAG: hypothetical protein A2V78_07285 [Betaproteobacteria bacterium RBG_16_64_18]|nr:MAG: hypothetical protein A2V78_07285 [Betaproteobacteria bacterium RBG_16_64_18]OGA12243.1 MAG: hypothetical protein A3H33_00535 [Betaproteobacteria bacterium RIFCSPLOWO2_02_FULL_65_20]OGA39547.1 MAG: hypothetical protein A3G26_03375 [Betaproteobacteria bacterium RIFCSPLOWO2_12_FULL_65_110]